MHWWKVNACKRRNINKGWGIKNEKTFKHTKRTMASLIAVSIIMGTAVPTTGLGRITAYAQSAEETTVVEQSVAFDEAQQAIVEAAKQEAQAAVGAVITVGDGIISDEALGIINEAQAAKNLDAAEDAIADGEAKVGEALEGFDEDINATEIAKGNAVAADEAATDAADDAEEALNAAKDADTSADAAVQQGIADTAADEAQKQADIAKEEAEKANTAYAEANAAYAAAVAEAEAAKKAANEALDSASADAAEAVAKAEAAEAKVAELKKEVETAKTAAENNFTEKQAELASAQEDLADAKAVLDDKADAEEEEREDVIAATEAVVETGAFLAAAEAYEALSEVAVDGIELAIDVMEEAKELAGKALEEAEKALENAEGDKADAQAAYDAALAAYEAADATLAQANADLEIAKAEKDSTDALAGSEYGQTLKTLEKELIDANAAGDSATVETKTQEIITTVIKYDYNADNENPTEAKYETVELENADENIYVAKDAEGNATYYQYVQNADNTLSFFECDKNESAPSIVTGEEIVTSKEEAESKVAELEYWQYKITELEGGSYSIEYLDAQENGTSEYANKADAEAEANIAEEGVTKIVYDETEVDDKGTLVAVEGTPNAVQRDIYIDAYENAINVLESFGVDTNNVPENPVEPVAPNYKDYGLTPFNPNYVAALAIYTEELGKYNAYVGFNTAKANYDKCTAEETRIDNLKNYISQGYELTINGITKVLSDNNGNLYYVNEAGEKVYDLTDCSVSVKKTTEKYRVVKYTETVKIEYTLKDNTADDSYENVTNKEAAAAKEYDDATDKVNAATTAKNEAEADEQAKAGELATAEEDLEKTQKVYDTIEKLYDSYYGNEEIEFEIPESVAKTIKLLGITDTNRIVSLLEKAGVLEKLGIEASADDMYIEISEDGQVTIEIPGTSKYAQHMLALEVAKYAAEENLEKAKETVAEKKADHKDALATLKTETEEYNAAVKELADAAVNVGKAEVKVADATVNVATAAIAYDAMKAADAYATKLEEEAAEAREAAEAALAKVNALKNNVSVSAEELEAAADALAEALEAKEAAEKAAADAQADADAAKVAYEEIAKIVEELAAKEAAAREEAEDDDDDYTSDREVITLPTGDVVVIAEAVTPLTATTTPAVVDIEDEETPLAAEMDDANVNGGDDEQVIVAEPEEEQAMVAIEDEETPLAAGMDDDGKMSWWWLLIVALLGATGYAMYRNYQNKKEEAQEA